VKKIHLILEQIPYKLLFVIRLLSTFVPYDKFCVLQSQRRA